MPEGRPYFKTDVLVSPDLWLPPRPEQHTYFKTDVLVELQVGGAPAHLDISRVGVLHV